MLLRRIFNKTLRSYCAFSTKIKQGHSSSENIPEHTTRICQNPAFDDSQNVFKGLESDFPCVSANALSGPEPEYDKIISGYKTFSHDKAYFCKYKGILPKLDIAYETWGELNSDKSNAVLIFTGLSASSHAKSHQSNKNPGWWENFIGPGCAIDSGNFFVICANHLGSCYGTTGPSSKNPLNDKNYGTTFPMISVEDMVSVQFLLLDYLGIKKLHSAVGSSLGGMCSLAASAMFPDRVGRCISISACAHSHPTSIAIRYLQRKTIMTDPNWNKGQYYDGPYPKSGMKLAREIATISYRSGPEWDQRFGRKRINNESPPDLCPNFVIESYLDYQGESFCTKYDPNSLLYISKAMDLFDLSEGYSSAEEGMAQIKCPVMILGVKTDVLFPVWQQRQLAQMLKKSGNPAVTYYEIYSLYGHDTFLLDISNVGTAVKGFLETDIKIVSQ